MSLRVSQKRLELSSDLWEGHHDDQRHYSKLLSKFEKSERLGHLPVRCDVTFTSYTSNIKRITVKVRYLKEQRASTL